MLKGSYERYELRHPMPATSTRYFPSSVSVFQSVIDLCSTLAMRKEDLDESEAWQNVRPGWHTKQCEPCWPIWHFSEEQRAHKKCWRPEHADASHIVCLHCLYQL